MTTITLPASADTAAARAALHDALALYGPPVTIVRPGHPAITVGVSADELSRRMAGLWNRFYATCAREGALSASEGGAKQETAREATCSGLTPASGVGGAGIAPLLANAVPVSMAGTAARVPEAAR